jgi:RNA polymerase sigma-70 factor (ECF subfamily)
VREYSNDLYRFAFRLCGNADTADDLVQETFYHAWKCIDKLRHKAKARAWPFQIRRYRYAH